MCKGSKHQSNISILGESSVARDTVLCAQALLAVSLPANYSPFFGSFSYSLRTPSPQSDTALPWGTWFPTLGTEPSFNCFNTVHFTESLEKHTHTHTQLSYNKNIKYDFLKSLKAQDILQNFPQIFSFF